jgi:very-short-patch-repair endonuclease
VAEWKKDLVELGARNNLLYYKDLAKGTLAFEGKEKEIDRLLADAPIRLSRVFTEDAKESSFAARARTIRKKAKEASEERGLDTMFVAIGLATWDESEAERRREPSAPVVLVPARLDPAASGGSDFDLVLNGDPHINPTLLRKLNTDFGLNLEAEHFDAQLIGAATLEGCRAVARKLEGLTAAVNGFVVDQRVVLGTFSYFKLPMVLDLDNAEDELAGHDLIAAICGDPEARGTVRERNSRGEAISLDFPDTMAPQLEHLVLDADASQSQAINMALAGSDVIVQGPPGTGKSQTIANLIAELVANGKTVLFVTEKRAAIDAVFKRLQQVGLDELLLDLHGRQTQRGQFAAELDKALDAHAGQRELDFTEEHRRLAETRKQLNDRVAALHGTRAPWGLSVFESRTRLAGLPASAASETRYRGSQLIALTAQLIAEAADSIKRWFELGARELFAGGEPWTGSPVRTPAEAEEAMTCAQETLRALLGMQDQVSLVCSQTGFPTPVTLSDVQAQLTLMDQLAALRQTFDTAAFAEDLTLLATTLEPMGAGGLKRAKSQLTSTEYRAAKHLLQSVLTSPTSQVKSDQLFTSLTDAAALQIRWSELTSAKPAVPSGIEDLRSLLDGLTNSYGRLPAALGPTAVPEEMPLAEAQTVLEAMTNRFNLPGAMAQINTAQDDLSAIGLGTVLDEIRSSALTREEALDRLSFIWLSSIIEELTLTDPLLTSAVEADHAVAEFQALDNAHIESGPVRVRRSAAEIAVKALDAAPDQDTLVQRQAALKPRSPKHITIRRFFEQAPDVLQAIRPCWAMSPLIVSQTLPATAGLFDVVIFDEASQVTPADAIPAMLRGKQLVVAGDTRQLPPTSFFASMNEDDSEDDDQPVDAGTQGFESILDALTGLIPERMLTWHYRSRDERLIAFSNAHIYDRSLTTFPGVASEDVVRHELVPQAPPLDGESADSAASEVERVVDLVILHAQERPDESLGVIAMGIKHSNRIEEALRQRIVQLDNEPPDDWSESDRESFKEFFREERVEAFFIKNLERVQGDERDAIILTVGYGKDPGTGKMLYRFGPILQDGGERRLNVAVTRAKQRMTVVSSFSSDDMDPARLNSDGAKLLKAFIAYAESGGRSLGRLDELPPELNPFEIQVRDALEARGLRVTPQLGVSGYRIDFAVRHPTVPGRYVMAIECDGASYHSSPTARTRDRLRQEHLERLGWRFCRIWSTNWFNDREKELARVVDAYQQAVARSDESPPDPFEQALAGTTAASAHRSKRGSKPKVGSRYDVNAIREIIHWVERDTLLRTSDQLFWAVLEALGFKQSGPKITPAIREAIRLEKGQVADSVGVPAPRPTKDKPRTPQVRKVARQKASPKSPIGQAKPAPPGRAPTERNSDLHTSPQPPLADAPSYVQFKALRIEYRSKSGKAVSSRVINPLKTSGRLLWAWDHKRGDVRCFNIQRIESWRQTSADEWPAPKEAGARVQERIRGKR